MTFQNPNQNNNKMTIYTYQLKPRFTQQIHFREDFFYTFQHLI